MDWKQQLAEKVNAPAVSESFPYGRAVEDLDKPITVDRSAAASQAILERAEPKGGEKDE